jgi:hypothetical protein
MSDRQNRSAASLNHSCFCTTVDRDALRQALAAELDDNAYSQSTITTHPNLFAGVSVFISAESVKRMYEVVQAHRQRVSDHSGAAAS